MLEIKIIPKKNNIIDTIFSFSEVIKVIGSVNAKYREINDDLTKKRFLNIFKFSDFPIEINLAMHHH